MFTAECALLKRYAVMIQEISKEDMLIQKPSMYGVQK